MELYFGNNIRNLRKTADITQDALAGALGVSAQSVSKWECGYGFPDITQLPAISNYFGVTIDELFSNNEEAKEAIKEEFIEKINTYQFASEEKIEFIQKYCRKYPKDMYYLCWLCVSVSDCIMANPELYDKYMPTMHSAVEALLDTEYRQTALATMLRVCKEEDVEKWLKECAYNQNYTRRVLLIDRYMSQKNNQLCRIHQGINKLENISTLLDERLPDQLGAVRKAEYQRSVLAVMRSFGKDGDIPDGWLYLYGYKQLVLSACLFGAGKKDEAWEEFEGGIENSSVGIHIPMNISTLAVSFLQI